jgi:PTH1 family peptidyl-tRNA hydrolase
VCPEDRSPRVAQASSLVLVVGLGNPGDEYAKSRHNLGFMVLEELKARSRAGALKAKFSGAFTKCQLGGRDIILLRPETYMNESGIAVRQLSEYYHIAPDELLIVFDDFALPFGSLRLRLSGSAGGHNGLSSVITHLSTAAFPRLRLGIGPLPPRVSSVDFVLGKFSPDEEKTLETVLQGAVETMEDALKLGLEKAVSRMSLRTPKETI